MADHGVGAGVHDAVAAIALLLVTHFVNSSATLGARIASIALPAILLMEILGAIIATFAIYRAGESASPWQPHSAVAKGAQRD